MLVKIEFTPDGDTKVFDIVGTVNCRYCSGGGDIYIYQLRNVSEYVTDSKIEISNLVINACVCVRACMGVMACHKLIFFDQNKNKKYLN